MRTRGNDLAPEPIVYKTGKRLHEHVVKWAVSPARRLPRYVRRETACRCAGELFFSSISSLAPSTRNHSYTLTCPVTRPLLSSHAICKRPGGSASVTGRMSCCHLDLQSLLHWALLEVSGSLFLSLVVATRLVILGSGKESCLDGAVPGGKRQLSSPLASFCAMGLGNQSRRVVPVLVLSLAAWLASNNYLVQADVGQIDMLMAFSRFSRRRHHERCSKYANRTQYPSFQCSCLGSVSFCQKSLEYMVFVTIQH